MTPEARALALCGVGHLLTHLYMLVFPAVVQVASADLGVPLGDAVEWSFAGYLLFGVGSLPAGWLGDRFGTRRLLVFCALAMPVASALVGFAPTPAWLVAGLALLGTIASIYHPCGIGYLSLVASRRGHALGWNGVAGNVGLAVAPIAAGVLAAHHGWRTAYLVLGAAGLALTLPLCLGRLPAEVPPPATAALARVASPHLPAARFHLGWFALVCGAMALSGLVYRSTTLCFPTYFGARAAFLAPLLDRWGSALQFLPGGRETAAGTLLTTLVYAFGIFGQYAGGRLADRGDLRVSYILFQALSVPGLVVLAVAGGPLAVAAGFVYVTFGMGAQPAENSLIARLSPAGRRSTAYGFKFVLTFGVGSFAVFLTGFVMRHGSVATVFAMAAAFATGAVALAAVLWLASRRLAPRVANL